MTAAAGVFGQQVPGLAGVVRDEELVGHDPAVPSVLAEQLPAAEQECDVEIVGSAQLRVMRPQVGLIGVPYRPRVDVRRVPDDDVEAARAHDPGELLWPAERPAAGYRGVLDETVTAFDGVVQLAGYLAADPRPEPQAQLGDLDGFRIEIHAIDILPEDAAGILSGRGGVVQHGPGALVLGQQHVEHVHQKGTGPARGIEDLNVPQESLVIAVVPAS